MNLEELQALVTNLVTATASNTEAIINLRATVEAQLERSEAQARSIETMKESITATTQTILENSQSQARAIENQRESIGNNAGMMADAFQFSVLNQRAVASAQETAAAALEVCANTSRNIDRLEQNIDRLEQTVSIIIRDNQADRERVRRLKEQG
jgi:hypothetical protein